MIAAQGETSPVKTSIGGHSVGNFSYRWRRIRKPARKPSLAELNKKLFADPTALLAWGEENTRRLTGQSRI